LLAGIGDGGEFGMPLHTNEPGMNRHFDRFDDAVRRLGNNL